MPSKEPLHTSGTRRDIKQVIERLVVLKSQYALRLGFRAMRDHAQTKRASAVILARLMSRACIRGPMELAFDAIRHHGKDVGVENPAERLAEAIQQVEKRLKRQVMGQIVLRSLFYEVNPKTSKRVPGSGTAAYDATCRKLESRMARIS
jgi:hypothetical protein